MSSAIDIAKLKSIAGPDLCAKLDAKKFDWGAACDALNPVCQMVATPSPTMKLPRTFDWGALVTQLVPIIQQILAAAAA